MPACLPPSAWSSALGQHLAQAVDDVGRGRVLHIAHSGGALITYLAAQHHLTRRWPTQSCSHGGLKIAAFRSYVTVGFCHSAVVVTFQTLTPNPGGRASIEPSLFAFALDLARALTLADPSSPSVLLSLYAKGKIGSRASALAVALPEPHNHPACRCALPLPELCRQRDKIDVLTFGGARSITRKYFSGRVGEVLIPFLVASLFPCFYLVLWQIGRKRLLCQLYSQPSYDMENTWAAFTFPPENRPLPVFVLCPVVLVVVNYYARNDPLVKLDRRAADLMKLTNNTKFQEVVVPVVCNDIVWLFT